jgi:hypothetical protein
MTASNFVMPGLVPGLHVFKRQFVDGRDKPGHD